MEYHHFYAPHLTQPSSSIAPQPPLSDFASLSSNYLNMLAQKPAENMKSYSSLSRTDFEASYSDPCMDVANMIGASGGRVSGSVRLSVCDDSCVRSQPRAASSNTPFNQTYSGFDDSFNSIEESPFCEFLTTPIEDYANADMMTSPLLDDSSSMALFADLTPFIDKPPLSQLDFEHLYTMSPATPFIDTLALKHIPLHHSPHLAYDSPSLPSPAMSFVDTPPHHPKSPHLAHDSFSLPVPPPRCKSSATGTRKNLKPQSLLPLDAPTQPRKYLTPSATSKKAVPASFAKKRARSQAPAEEDELEDPKPLGPDATELEQIEHKRRQNTIAARRIRMRKLEHQRQLEEQVKKLRRDGERWRTCALTLASTLRAHNIPFEFGELDN